MQISVFCMVYMYIFCNVFCVEWKWICVFGWMDLRKSCTVNSSHCFKLNSTLHLNIIILPNTGVKITNAVILWIDSKIKAIHTLTYHHNSDMGSIPFCQFQFQFHSIPFGQFQFQFHIKFVNSNSKSSNFNSIPPNIFVIFVIFPLYS